MSDVEKVKELLKKSSNDTALYLLRYSNLSIAKKVKKVVDKQLNM